MVKHDNASVPDIDRGRGHVHRMRYCLIFEGKSHLPDGKLALTTEVVQANVYGSGGGALYVNGNSVAHFVAIVIDHKDEEMPSIPEPLGNVEL